MRVEKWIETGEQEEKYDKNIGDNEDALGEFANKLCHVLKLQILVFGRALQNLLLLIRELMISFFPYLIKYRVNSLLSEIGNFFVGLRTARIVVEFFFLWFAGGFLC